MLCSLFFSYVNVDIKKETLTVELPFTLCPLWLLQNIFILFYALKIPLLDALLNYETNTMLMNGTPSPPNNPIFNISQ
jgi:hypothetical protein